MIAQDVTALPTLTTWWAHNPQFHRIKTWLSCTPLFLKLFLTLGFVWKITTHLPSDLFWYQAQYLFPLLWTPFTLCFRQQTIAYPLKASYCTSLHCSWWLLEFQLERCLYAMFSEIAPRSLSSVELCTSRVSPLTPPLKSRDEISCSGGDL